jgi:replication-associated recombination protein RarA
MSTTQSSWQQQDSLLRDEESDQGGKGPPPTRRGLAFDEAASTLQGSLRRGDEELALRIAADLDESGFGAYVWRRLLTVLSEDVGLAEPQLPATVRALYESWFEAHQRRRGSGSLFLVHAVLLLARARKSREVNHALIWAYNDEEPLDVPDFCLDVHTKRGRAMGRGIEHFWAEKALLADPASGELKAPQDRYVERAQARHPDRREKR